MAKRNSARRVLGMVAILIAAGGSAALAAPPAPTQTVNIARSSFLPPEITIAPGTRVVWVNHDEMPHTVTSGNKTFASKGLDTDDRFEHTFVQEGDFDYRCTIHPYMRGVVHVRR